MSRIALLTYREAWKRAYRLVQSSYRSGPSCPAHIVRIRARRYARAIARHVVQS